MYKELLERFLDESKSDDVSLLEISCALIDNFGFSRLKLTVEQGGTIWDATCKMVTILLQNGFTVGDLRNKGNYTPWPSQKVADVVEKIAQAYAANKDNIPGVQFSIWFKKQTRVC